MLADANTAGQGAQARRAGAPPFYDVVVLGAGPCGLGAAWALQSLQAGGAAPSYALIDANPAIGGSAASVTTAEGFVFDFGGHILYPHEEYGEFIALLDEAVDSWYESKPVRGVWIDNRLIPYPVQRNIHRLPARKFMSSLHGLGRVALSRRLGLRPRPADNLEGHLQGRFGRGLTKHVLGPINEKMWAHHPVQLGASWTAHRSGSQAQNVPDASVRQILRSVVTRQNNLGWTEATRVRYPLHGGTGAIWAGFAKRLPPEAVMASAHVLRIDADAHELSLADGRTLGYGRLVSSIPLDHLLGLFTRNPLPEVDGKLRYANAAFVGLGLRGEPPAFLRGVHSFHMPERDIPCWRVNFPKSLSPMTVPPGPHWSILCEISHAHGAGFDLAGAERQIIAQLGRKGILPPSAEIVSRWSSEMKHGYPLPFLGRDEVLKQVQEVLHGLDVFSRGRFGGWKYEVSNQDHTFMQGVEAVRSMFGGAPETTYRFPA